MQAIREVNGRPAVSVSWMVDSGVISLGNIKNLIVRGDIEKAQRACNGREALVYADNMPSRFKNKIIDMVGDIYQAMQSSLLEVEHDAKAAQFFGEYETAEGRLLPKDREREYYSTACVLNAIGKFINENNGKRASRGGRKVKFWDVILSNLDKIDAQAFPFKLPNNVRSLERKFSLYKAEGYESLVHAHYKSETRNAAKIAGDDQKKALTELLTAQNWDAVQVANLYNSVAKSQGWKEITSTTVLNFYNFHKSELYAARRGKNALMNDVAMQVKRKRPSTPLLYWTRDGWKAELFYRTEESPYNTMTLEVVIDTYCDYPIGYAIADREGVDLIKAAMRDAVLHTEELFGKMYRVNQLQSDNYGKKGMREIDENVSSHFTPAAVGNAKAKVVEPYFKKLNHDYCSLLPNWSGYGVTSRKECQPNPELVKMRSKNFPTKEQCIEQIREIIMIERATKRQQMLDGFKKMKSQHLVEMKHRDFLSLWGEETETRSLMRGQGLIITIGGVKRTFECFDQGMRRHPAERWAVRYDPEDLSKALAISEDGRLVYDIEEKYVQPMALADRTEGDAEQLQRVRDFNRELRNTAMETVCGSTGTINRLMSQRSLDDGENPAMIDGADHLQKMLLTDRKGRHKDALNDIRCGQDETREVEYDEEDDVNDVFNDY